MRSTSLAVILFSLTSLLSAQTSQPVIEHASQFISKLTADQKKTALFPLRDYERENWHYVPLDRKGLRLGALNDKQKDALQKLLSVSLSSEGHTTAKEIMELENLLYERSNKAEFRNPGNYTAAFFGTPSAEDPWGWRFEGHHLSLNFTVVSDKVTLTTPFFCGTNPAVVREGELKGLRPLGQIEDAARALARELHGEGLHVRYTNEPRAEILTKQDRIAKKQAKEGTGFPELNEKQQKQLLSLVQMVAARQRKEFLPITAKDLAEGHLAWAGEFEKGKPHYFRIQTPTFLIEYANTQNQGNHAHLVWRDFDGDFGRDVLKEHLDHHH